MTCGQDEVHIARVRPGHQDSPGVQQQQPANFINQDKGFLPKIQTLSKEDIQYSGR